MSEEAAFLRAIIADSDDDEPRLVFADWLDDHGDHARAEFIRIQCRIADDLLSWASLDWFRQDELADRHGPTWTAELPTLDGVSWRNFTRGMPEWADTKTIADFLRHADALRDLTPVRCVSTAGPVADLVRGGQLGWLRGLHLSECDSPQLIAGCRELAGLRWLTLWGIGGDAGMARLAASPHLASLRALELSDGSLTAQGVAWLAASSLTGLRSLELGGARGECVLGAEGVAALARSPSLHLRSLCLNQVGLGDDAADALSAGSALADLQSLELGNGNIGPAGARALAALPVLAGLGELVLRDNAIGPDGLAALLASPHFSTLRRLDVSFNQIGPSGAAALAASPLLAGIVNLEVGASELGDAGVKTLVASPHLAGLRRLCLSFNQLTDDALAAIAAAPALAGLVELRLVGVTEGRGTPASHGPTAAGVHWLAHSPHLRSLRRLDLTCNDLDLEAVRVLSASPLAARLTHLDLSASPPLDADEVAQLFGDRDLWPALIDRWAAEP